MPLCQDEAEEKQKDRLVIPRAPVGVPWDRFPARTLSRVFHVGSPEYQTGHRSMSYEGPGISVSLCPEIWRGIARLGAQPVWALERKDEARARFLDVHALRKEDRVALNAASVAAGLLETALSVFVVRFDDEMEDDVRLQFRSVSEAVSETSMDDTLVDIARLEARAYEKIRSGASKATVVTDPESGSEIIIEPGFVPSLALCGWWKGFFTTDLPDILAEEMAWSHMLQAGSSLDGLWWEDDCDPSRYSAPRGVVVPSRIGAWHWSPV